jgi:hypothetical protein
MLTTPVTAAVASAGLVTVASLAGRWRLTITDIAGDDDARWTIGAVPLRIAHEGDALRGTVRNAMPDIACTHSATHGDALPPVPPMGPLEGTIADRTITLVLGRHWTLVGTLDAAGTVLTGDATYREHVQGIVLERRGRFVAVRLPR